MAEIIRLFIIVICVYLAFHAVMFIAKRAMMLIRIYSLKKECNAKISLHRCPFLPFLPKDGKADITVEILDTVYAIRLYSGISSTKFVHFVDDEYSVVYRRLRAVMPNRAAVKIANGIALVHASGGHVNIMGRMSEEIDGKRCQRILLFSPAPHEVSYVTEEKTTIRLAFTGDTLYGYKVFTTSTLVTYLDREKRRLEDEKKNNTWC
jgi:hypothetical protein